MQKLELFNAFKALNHTDKDDKDFPVLPLNETNHKLGVSKEGYPMLFICTSDSSYAAPIPLLDMLSVEYNASCTFIDDTNISFPHHYTIITLHSLDELLQEEFLDLILMIVSRISGTPSKREISIEVENLISIFSALTCPPRKKIQGLWGELLVIEQSFLPETLINAWHSELSAKYDFTMGRDKIEVKTTSSETREHHFSLDQLSPSAHSRVVVASMIVRNSAQGSGGLSIDDLYIKICDKVASVDAKMRLMQIVSETIGSDFHCLKEVCFDYIEACDSLRFYNAQDVPRIPKDSVQPGVSSVGFTSNLTGIVDIQSSESSFERGESPLYKSLFK